jgi:Na+-driven multidrug efflux pump
MLVVGAYLWGLKGAIIGFSTNIGFHWLITYFATKKEATKASVLIRFTGFKEHLRVFWTYSFPAVISGTMVAPVLWYARTTLTGSLNGYAELGVFEAAYSWLLIVNYISSKVSRSSFPILAKSYGDGNRLQFLKILKIQSLFNGVVTLFFAIIVAVFSKVIMGFYGEGFAQQNTVLIILSFTGVFMQLSLIMGLVNKSVGNIWYGAMLNGLWAFILIVGSESLSEYGAVGLSIAFLIAYAAHFIFTLIYVGLVFKFSPKLRKVSKDKIDAEKT